MKIDQTFFPDLNIVILSDGRIEIYQGDDMVIIQRDKIQELIGVLKNEVTTK